MRIVYDVEVPDDRPLAFYSAVVLYLPPNRVTDATAAALDDYVVGGGALLSIHTAAAADEVSAFAALLGGRCLAREEGVAFTVQHAGEPLAAFTQGFPALPAFSLFDELHIHEYDAENRVHYVTETESGAEPVAWSRSHGRGRVFYLSPGRRGSTLRNPSVRKILQYALTWAVGADQGS